MSAREREATLAVLRTATRLLESASDDDSAEVPSIHMQYMLGADATPQAVTGLAAEFPGLAWTWRVNENDAFFFLDGGGAFLSVTISGPASVLANEHGPRTVTDWAPKPEIAALLAKKQEGQS